MQKALLIIIISIVCATQVGAQPLHEIRAVWMATIGGIDWPRTKATDAASRERQKEELRQTLDRLQQANINMVVLQTRVRGTVIYPSAIEPWDDTMTGKYGQDPGYDPLAFAVEECHRRGMELHAWLVCIPLGTAQKQRAYGSKSITKRRPELCKTAGGEVFMQPAQSGTADYITNLCREIVERYDVDGISLDYIRYPERTYRFSDRCTPDERRENISRIVRRVHDVVKALKPWVKLSSSPIGKFRDLGRYSSTGWNCYDAVYQDAQRWLREGWQDMLFPMMYFQDNHFYPFLFDWLENSHGRPVAPGLGIYFLDPREGRWKLNDVRAQMYTARKAGIGGMVFYRSDFLTRNCKGIYDCVRDEFFPYPALPPRMTWTGDTLPPLPPTDVHYEKGVLRWTATQTPTDARKGEVFYNVYGAQSYPVDVSKPENLLLTRIGDTHVELSGRATGKRYYAVCASDRMGNQSTAAQENAIIILPDSIHAWNPCSRMGDNGKRVDDRMQLLKSPREAKGKKKSRKR